MLQEAFEHCYEAGELGERMHARLGNVIEGHYPNAQKELALIHGRLAVVCARVVNAREKLRFILETAERLAANGERP